MSGAAPEGKQVKSEGARTVGRVLRALELLASQSTPLRLTDIARELEVPTSSAHALLQQLIKHDYARVLADDRRYIQGARLVLLGSRVRAGLKIVKEARSIIEDLAAATGENVYLGVCQARGIVYADSVEAESGVVARFQLGNLRPLHATSPGKIFLAFSGSSESLDSLLGQGKLASITRYTKTNRDVLKQEIRTVRERGFAINEQEAVEGAFGISAPVFDADASLAGCVTLGLPEFRFKDARNGAINRVVAAAKDVSLRLGQDRWNEIVRSFAALKNGRP